jgi:hypothetical protein
MSLVAAIELGSNNACVAFPVITQASDTDTIVSATTERRMHCSYTLGHAIPGPNGGTLCAPDGAEAGL